MHTNGPSLIQHVTDIDDAELKFETAYLSADLQCDAVRQMQFEVMLEFLVRSIPFEIFAAVF